MNQSQAPSGLGPDLSGVRIAKVSTVPFFVLTQLREQIDVLCKCGAEVTVVTSDGAELSRLKQLSSAAVQVIDIPRSLSPLRDARALLRLYLFFRRERIQIAHSTTPKAGLLTALAAFFARVPLRLHTFTGQPWVNMHGLKRWLVRGCDRLIGALNTRCYADSHSQRDFLLAQGVLGPAKLGVIGAGSLAGVDVRRFHRERFPPAQCVALRATLHIPVEAPVLLFVGRITPEKGVGELLRAYGALKAEGNPAHLVVVGQFDEGGGMPGHISAADIAAQPDTHLVGYSDCPESYMAVADLLCLPSYREGFGTVVIEAAAIGLPTVGSRVYGLTDAVVDGETGLLVEPRSSEALALALRSLLSDRHRLAAMGQAAELRARKLFDAHAVNQQVAQDYANMVRESRLAQGRAKP